MWRHTLRPGDGSVSVPYLAASSVLQRGDVPSDRIAVDGHGPEDQSLESLTGAVLLVVFLVSITVLFHGDVNSAQELIQLFKNLAIIGGLLLVADQDSRG